MNQIFSFIVAALLSGIMARPSTLIIKDLLQTSSKAVGDSNPITQASVAPGNPAIESSDFQVTPDPKINAAEESEFGQRDQKHNGYHNEYESDDDGWSHDHRLFNSHFYNSNNGNYIQRRHEQKAVEELCSENESKDYESEKPVAKNQEYKRKPKTSGANIAKKTVKSDAEFSDDEPSDPDIKKSDVKNIESKNKLESKIRYSSKKHIKSDEDCSDDELNNSKSNRPVVKDAEFKRNPKSKDIYRTKKYAKSDEDRSDEESKKTNDEKPVEKDDIYTRKPKNKKQYKTKKGVIEDDGDCSDDELDQLEGKKPVVEVKKTKRKPRSRYSEKADKSVVSNKDEEAIFNSKQKQKIVYDANNHVVKNEHTRMLEPVSKSKSKDNKVSDNDNKYDPKVNTENYAPVTKEDGNQPKLESNSDIPLAIKDQSGPTNNETAFNNNKIVLNENDRDIDSKPKTQDNNIVEDKGVKPSSKNNDEKSIVKGEKVPEFINQKTEDLSTDKEDATKARPAI